LFPEDAVLDNPLPFLLFVLAMTSTPGPGNLASLALGQTFGFRAAVPFLAGSALGFAGLNLLVALGLGRLLTASPALWTALQALGLGYIVYLAWRILRAHLAEPGAARRLGLWEGALVHPFSPKSWAMSVAGFGQFADPAAPLSLQAAFFVLAFFAFQVSAHSLWCVAGAALLRWLRRPAALACCNAAAVGLMVTATAWALLE
jgi:threonine/homoserine/homoserine lactone efflux protein